MKVTDVFLFIMYGIAAGYVIYFVSYIYNRSTRTIVYNETMPVYSETVVYPWLGGGYNWWPYWSGWWSGGGDGGYNRSSYNYKNIGHIGNHVQGSYHLSNRPWGDGGRGSNGGGAGHTGGGNTGGGGGGGGGGGHGGGAR